MKQLCSLPLYDGKNYYEIIGTMEEDDKMTDYHEKLDDRLEYFKNRFPIDVSFNEKILNLIDKSTNVIRVIERDDGTKDFELQLDTFALFYHLFNNTFRKCVDE